MSYTNAVSDRMEDLRFRNGHSQRNESSLLGGLFPHVTNGNASRLPQTASVLNDSRGSLTRRFTTDSARTPTLNSLAVQRNAMDSQDYAPSTQYKVQLLEKKKQEYERLREQKRRFEAEMQLLDLQQRQDERELAQLQDDLTRAKGSSNSAIAGHQSEPSTPPEFLDTTLGFPSAFSRPNRYSTSSLTSPLGLFSRPGRSGSQLTSPPSGLIPSRYARDDALAKSVPGSRRNSDEDEKEEAVRQDPSSHRTTNGKNRYSMPVGHSRSAMNEIMHADKNAIGNLLDDDEDTSQSATQMSFLHHQTNADGIPILVNNNGHAASTTMEHGATSLGAPDSSAWVSYQKHRAGQQSLPGNGAINVEGQNGSGMNGAIATESKGQSYRRSLDFKHFTEDVPTNPVKVPSAPPKLQSSFSTNDIPTIKTSALAMGSLGSNSHAQQHFHNHNASLGRIPPNAVNNRLSRDLSAESPVREAASAGAYQSINSALHANAPSFGPPAVLHASVQNYNQQVNAPPLTQYNVPNYGNNYGGYQSAGSGYNMPMLTSAMQHMNTGPVYAPQNHYGYGGAGMYQNSSAMAQHGGQINRGIDSQARVIQQRRNNDGEAMNRFTNLPLESLGGEIYILCKDQHGCRYLQKKLEERNPEHVHMIWLETNQHVTELMTDPFGNYLCQKLFEYSNDAERTVLVENAAHDLVRIALNQHGTRALQKMIEFISTPGQVQIIIEALRHQVVDLIQDLNGNHVIQKCLNKLTPLDAQFIFDAVGSHCIDVGTHRHGCCVLQRCIDHASGDQKAWLIRQISDNAFRLVQDPFGNYVVQYILDLNEPAFTEPLVMMFQGHVSVLSRQKFSSNVIEKCLRCAQDPSKEMIVGEILHPAEIAKLIRDPFSNYVIQTALDYVSPVAQNRLVEAIRPLLPEIRTTPYGRRISAKIMAFEARNEESSGSATPGDGGAGQIPLRQVQARTVNNAAAIRVRASSPYLGYTRNRPLSFPSAQQIGAAAVSSANEHQGTYENGGPYGLGTNSGQGGNYI